MEFLLSPDLNEFRGVLRKFFDDRVSSELLRSGLLGEDGSREAGGGTDRAAELWTGIAELGALCAGVPEQHDGLGFGPLARQLVVEEAGRALFPAPLFETIAFGITPLSVLGSDDAKKSLLPKLASGELKATGAFEHCFDSGGEQPVVSFRKGTLTGTLDLVPSYAETDILIVPSDELCLVKLDSAARETITDKPVATFDLLRQHSTLELKGTPAELVSEKKPSRESWSLLFDQLALLCAAEMVGAGDKVLAMTIEHVTTRKQFGKPIGSFQAVQHKLADICLELQQCQALGRFGAWCVENDPAQFREAAAAAKALAGDVVPDAIEKALQAHGGIAFTYEYDLHLYLRRVKMLSAGYGCSADYYRSLGQLQLAAGG